MESYLAENQPRNCLKDNKLLRIIFAGKVAVLGINPAMKSDITINDGRYGL